MDVTQFMLGLGGGILLGTLVDLASSRTQRLLASLGVALVACGAASSCSHTAWVGVPQGGGFWG